MLSFLFDFAFKGFLYAVPPLIFAIRRKESITKKSIVLHIALINGTIYAISVALMLPDFNLAGVPIPFIWSAIAYKSLLGIFSTNKLLIDSNSTTSYSNDSGEVVSVYRSDYVIPVRSVEEPVPATNEPVKQDDPTPQQRGVGRITYAICTCVVILSIACTALGTVSYQAHKRISLLEKELVDAQKQIASLEESVDIRQRALMNILDDDISNLEERLRKVERKVIPKEESWQAILDQYGLELDLD